MMNDESNSAFIVHHSSFSITTMAFFPPNNALAWAHFRLRGGWVRSLTSTVGAMVLLAFSLFVWVACAFASFAARMGAAMLFIPLAIPYMTQGGMLSLLPAMTVILSPVIGSSIFDMRTSGVVLPATYALAFAAQLY